MTNVTDARTRTTALNSSESYIVQAPAGSGKTAVLIQRILVLLAEVERAPEECLAITFTRKAALEMRDRILEALENAAKHDQPPSQPNDHQTWILARALLKRDQQEGWNLLQNPSRLKIQTIDALCASLTRQMPMVSGFGATPNVTLDPMPLYLKAARNLIESLESNEPLQDLHNLLDHLDNHLDLAERLLAEMLMVRDQWLPSIGLAMSSNKARSLLEQGLQAAIKDTLYVAVQNCPAGMEDILELAKFAADQLSSTQSDSAILHCQSISSWPGQTLEDLPQWQGLAELCLTEKNTFRKTLTQHQGFIAPSAARNREDKAYYQLKKQQMLDQLRQLETEYPAFRDALQSVRQCPPLTYSDSEWAVLEGLIGLLPLLVGHLMLVFRSQGQVDFAEIAIAARRALGDVDAPSDLALGLDYKIKHILVDEFQDISIPQLQLLTQLTTDWQNGDGRTLFLVGDPQQSIYRFRQAEVGLFLQVKQKGIGNLSLKPLTLTSNFRSHPNLVAWVNQTFSGLFPKQDNVINGMIAFNPSTPALDLADQGIELDSQTVTLETEPDALLQLIKKAQQLDPNGSLALLVRSRTQLNHLIPALRQQQIAFQGIDIERLSQQPLFQDVLSLTRALLHLGDRIAWLSLLRSPWVGLTLHDLWLVANHEPRLPIWWALQSLDKLTLSASGHARLRQVLPCLETALLNRDRYPLARWVRETLDALTDGINWTEEEAQYLGSFFSALEAEGYSSDFYNPHLVITRLEALYTKPGYPVANQLQIMTIHKSKGLEFDTVILAGLDRRRKADSEKLLLWESRASLTGDPYFILAPIKSSQQIEHPTYSYLKRENQKRAQFEETRLLYVASTRARKRLYWLRHQPES